VTTNVSTFFADLDAGVFEEKLSLFPEVQTDMFGKNKEDSVNG